MFARVFTFLPLALLVSASHLAARDSCPGVIECCDKLQSIQDAQSTLKQYNLVDAAATAGGQVGLNCVPITSIGAGKTCKADQQPVCCTKNDLNGAVLLGCNPINVSP